MPEAGPVRRKAGPRPQVARGALRAACFVIAPTQFCLRRGRSRLAKVPVDAGHQAECLASERGRQVLVGCVLGAAGCSDSRGPSRKRSARRRGTPRGSPRTARADHRDPVSSPISISHLALKPSSTAFLSSTAASAARFMSVLALVVGGAAPPIAPLGLDEFHGDDARLPAPRQIRRITSPWP